MPRHIETPTVVQAAGNKPKQIQEFVGRVNSGHENASVARMVSPGGWVEPGQRPEFEEVTLVLRGMVRVEYEGGVLDVRAGQAVVTSAGEWIRYSSPEPEGAEVHRRVPARVLTLHGASRSRLRRASRPAHAGRCERRNDRMWRTARGIRSLGSFQG